MDYDTTVEPAADVASEGGDALVQPLVRIREEHNISRRDIDPDALKVLYRLSRNNFIAYLVGGGVRDLLLGRKPKDFDVSTDARPEQIRSLFRNCILIGRRFRLAHVRYGDKIIETSTFRSTPKQEADPSDPEADLFQRDDNLFGTPQEDALRRDFTVNGLFYDIESFSIIDYVGGMEDLAARRIRSIGDPCIRFREDPVRMIRAVRFASRLHFTLEPDTEDAIRKHGEELAKASPARLLEEIARLFAFSAGERSVRLMHATGLLRVILPEVADCLDSDAVDNTLFWKRLEALDKGDTVLPDATPALIFSVLLLDSLKARLGRDWTFAESPRLRFDKVHAFLEPLALRLRFPRKLVDRIVHMYITQHRFASSGMKGKRGSITSFVTQDAFHEALALAEIILTAEGGSQTKLNQWREMLAERMYGRDDAPQPDRRDHNRHGNGNGNGRYHGGNHHGGNGHDGNGGIHDDDDDSVGDTDVLPAIAAGSEALAATAEGGEESLAGRKMSRSARRRRNKRLRRMRGGDEKQPAAAQGDEGGEEQERSASPAAAEKREEEARPAEAGGRPAEGGRRSSGRTSRRDRRGRSRRREEEGPGTGAPEAVPASEAEAVVRPLTAAAFWTSPETEPEPEPVPEAEPETKKKGGRKAKGEGGKAKRGAKEEKKAEDEAPKPLSMDKADEADIPMHWLDEI